MNNLMLTTLSFANVIVFLSAIIWLSKRYKFYGKNELLQHREQHISRLGGIAVFLSFGMIVMLFVVDRTTADFYFLHNLFLLFLLGLYDDLFDVRAGVKFVAQLIIAALAVFYGQVRYHFLFVEVVAVNAIIENVFSVVLLVYVINAFNLIDGIDGLAAMLGALINLFLGIVLAIHEEALYASMAFVLFGTLSGFLLFNFSPARVFMGDSGSMIIGFISSIIALKFIEINIDVYPSVYTGSLLVAALFIVPLYDTIRVFVIRLKHKRSPFSGDYNHIHHRLRRMGLQDYQIVLLLTSYTLMMVILVFLLQNVGVLFLCVFMLMICILFNTVVDHQLKKSTIKQIRNN